VTVVHLRDDSQVGRSTAIAAHFIVQGSGVMFHPIDPDGWTHTFALYVMDQDGVPVTGLTKGSFKVFALAPSVGPITIKLMIELNKDIPSSKMPGVYDLQSGIQLGNSAPGPQELAFAIRAARGKRGAKPITGTTTAAIT
jgi:hypothetical protein